VILFRLSNVAVKNGVMLCAWMTWLMIVWQIFIRDCIVCSRLVQEGGTNLQLKKA